MSVAFSRSSSSKSFSLSRGGHLHDVDPQDDQGVGQGDEEISRPFCASRTTQVPARGLLEGEGEPDEVAFDLFPRRSSDLPQPRKTWPALSMARMVLHSEQRNRPALEAFSFLLQMGHLKMRGNVAPFAFLSARGEEGHRLVEVLLDVEELGEAEELEHLVDLRLDLQEDEVAAARLRRP